MSVSALPLPVNTDKYHTLGTLAVAVRAFSFWLAVVLPFSYLPMLAAGLDSLSMLLTFVALVTLNVCAIVVGQPYRR